MTTVFNINNIKDIAILAFDGTVSYINPEDFKNAINLSGGINAGSNLDISCGGWETRPQNAHKIIDHAKLTNSSYTNIGSKFDKGKGAPHDNNNKYVECSKFWNLYDDNRMTTEKRNLYNRKFKKFNDANNHIDNWIGNEDGRYSSNHAINFRLYWRVYYRTWDDFFSICKTSYDKNDCYNELVSYSNNCKNSDQRFTNNCKNACDEKWTDGTIRNNCAQGLINYSSNCKNGNQRYNDNCKFTCDPKWTDGNLQENCNYGIAQWCNDDDNYKNTGNFDRCQPHIANIKYTAPYNKFKETCVDIDNYNNKDFCTTYLKNNNIFKRFNDDLNNDCDMSKNPNNYNKCKGIINSQDDIGNKFINWCKDNSTNANCNDLFTSKDWESLRDRYNDNILKTVCNTSDNIIKDERCKKLLDSNDLNIKNKADDVLSKYCNTDNKIFNTNPLDDPSCYRIANNKCLTASSDADKNVCNQYYINIIKKLEKNSDVNTNVLYIYYDDVNFQRLPVFYQFKKTISLSDIDNPKNFNSINQSILNNNWSAKVFAFIQPDTNANYTFLIGADDGIRFFINNINLLNNYPQYTNSKESNSIILNKDQIYFFYFEFYENDGAAKLSIQYKKDNQTEFKSIPDSWYKPFKLYSEINKFYEDTLLKYMIDYPQYFLSDSKYRIRLKNDNNDVNNSIINYCKQNSTNDINDCVKYVREPMNYIIKNSNYNINKNTNDNCDNWADHGECTSNNNYMLELCPKSCKDKNKNKLFDSLFIERLNSCISLLETSNYTNTYAINYIINELIPYLKKINSNNITKVYNYLLANKVIYQKLLNFAENDANIEFTNNYIKYIYTEFKDIPDIIDSMKNIIVKRCKKVNKDKSYRFSTEEQCFNYIKTDTGLNKTIVDYCNTDDNMKNQYCTNLDNSIIQGHVNKILPVNTELATNINNARINYTKNKLKNSKYTDEYSINYLNNEYKTLIDNLNISTTDRNIKYLDLVDKDAMKFCEDNYLEFENTTKPFCKQSYNTYKSVPDINNSLNKITEQNCLYNNKFVTDTECNKFANDNKNYIKFINPNNKYCSTDDNIVSDYCQNYYKNTENKINDLLIQNNCNNFSTFQNKNDNDNNLVLHNVELESFENKNNYYILVFILIFIFIILSIYYHKNIYKFINKFAKKNNS